MRFRKSCTFLYASKSKKLMLKSPASTIFFRFLPFFENISLKSVSNCFISPLGGMYIVLRIIFLDLVFDISIERDWIASHFMLKSSLSLKLRISCTKTQLLLPYDFFLFDLRPYKLTFENSNFCWKIRSLPMFLKTSNATFEVTCRRKLFERFKILIHVCNI